MTEVVALQLSTEVASNDPAAIRRAVTSMLEQALGPEPHEVVSVLFFSSPDLTAAFPSSVARAWGFTDTPLMGLQRASTSHGERSIEALVHVIRAAEEHR